MHDPRVFADEFLLEFYPLIPRCLHKSWLPKKLIQFNYSQSGDLTKLPGEGRFARSSRTDDHHSFHADQFSVSELPAMWSKLVSQGNVRIVDHPPRTLSMSASSC